jgi:hypothetical protein
MFETKQQLTYAFLAAQVQIAVKKSAVTFMSQITEIKTIGNIKKTILFVVVGVSAILLGMWLFLENDLNVNSVFSTILIIVGVVDVFAGIYAIHFLRSRRSQKI